MSKKNSHESSTKRNASKRPQSSLDNASSTRVDSSQSSAPEQSNNETLQTQQGENIMSATETQTGAEQSNGATSLTFVRNDKQRRSNMIVFDAPEGRRGSVRVSKTLFAKDQIPTSINFSDPNLAQPKVPLAKLTPEERKARRAAMPKLTPAEKLAKAEERIAKLRAKVQATQNAPASDAAATM